MSLTAKRILDRPIIWPHMDARMGDNINGPAMFRVPEWLPDPLGRYYLYFSHHKGTYIRLAVADAITGPWTIHAPGVLELADSLFEPRDPPEPPEAERPAWARRMKGGYLYAHIASPDVHLDHERQRVRMYFHGLLANGDQQTRLALSTDGRRFQPFSPLLGPPYFRAFEYDGAVFAITWGGEIWRAPAWEGPFECGPQLVHYDARSGIGEGFRHGEVHRRGDTLYVLYSRMGDCPERIVYVEIDLRAPWTRWCAGDPQALLAPELDWEGAELPLEVATMGADVGRVRALRDPCVFVDDDGATYLLYCGAGEHGIGLAALHGL